MKKESVRVARKTRRKDGERGSALLIVFLFAAIIGILLYKEMPVFAFEAARSREQLLIDRGNEYAHAVKLYYRKFGMYPASIDQLENTNRMRFLRHKFKDPLTGKDDWRLLHAGPSGQLIDSKVNPLTNTPGGNGTNGSGSTSSNSTNGSNSFAQNGTGSNSAQNGTSSNSGSTFASTSTFGFGSNSDSSTAPVMPTVPQRPPAIAANGSGTATGAQTDPNLLPPPLPTLEQLVAAQQNPQNTVGTNPAGAAANGQTSQTGALGANGAQGQNGNATTNGMNANGTNGVNTNTATGQTNGTATGLSSGTNASSSSSSSSSGMGVMNSGGLAGVASIAKGHSIKVINDQKDYSLWEFYYDPTKDATRGIANALNNATQAGGTGVNGTAGANGTQTGSTIGAAQIGAGQNGTNANPNPNVIANPVQLDPNAQQNAQPVQAPWLPPKPDEPAQSQPATNPPNNPPVE